MKKILIIITGLFVFLSINAQNPTFTWAKQLGRGTGRSIVTDATGNVYTTGNFIGTTDFDPGAGVFNLVASGTEDIFISKLDANGNFVWAKRIGIGGGASECGNGITIDPSGNVLVTGYFGAGGPVDFDPGAGSFNLQGYGTTDIFILKLDAAGNFVWAVTFIQNASQADSRGASISTDASGSVYSTGFFTNQLDFDPGAGNFFMTTLFGSTDAYVSKLNSSGSFVWAKQIATLSGVSERGNSIVSDASGNVYSTGYFQNTIDFDPNAGTFNITSLGILDVYIQKLDVAGNFVWAKQLGGTNSEIGCGICLDASNNVYSTGYFYNTADFDPGTGTFNLTSIGVEDIYISKLDVNGNFIWAKQMGGTSANIPYTIVTDPSGNVITTGWFSGTCDFDPGAGVFNLTEVGGTEDIYVSKLNSSGNFVCAFPIASINSEWVSATTTDASGNIYTTGYFSGITDFDPQGTTFNMTPVIGSAIFVQKLASCTGVPSAPGAISGNILVCNGTGQSYSIAAVGGATSYNWSLPGGWTGSSSTNLISTTVSATSGNVTVTAINGCGTSAAQTLSVTVNTSPATPGTISGLSSMCVGAGATNYSVSSVAGATSYTWSLPGGWLGGSATNIISATPGTTGIFTVTASNSCGTSSQRTLNVTVNPLPTIIVNSGTICNGQNFTMVPSGASTYTFQGGSAVVSPTTNTSYTVTGTSAAGCVSAGPATSNVTVNATPIITVNSGAICSGQSFTMSPSGASTYTFSSGSAIVSPTANASYSVTGTSTAGCVGSNTAIASVTVNSIPVANASTTQTLTCVNTTATLNGSGVSTYTWSGPGIVSGGNSATPIANIAGIYSLIGTTSGCVSNTATVSLTSNTTPPSVSVTATSSSICIGNSATLTASGANTYSWSTTSTSTSIVISPTTTTNYILTGTNTVNGCTNTINKSIGVNPLPIVTANTSNSLICGPPFQGTSTITASGANTYTWNTTATTTVIAVSPSVTTNYTVTGTDANGCVNSTSFTQSVSACTSINQLVVTGTEIIIYPNPFNDKITVVSNGDKQSVQIFNMLGSLIRSTVIENKKTEIDLAEASSGIYFIKIGTITKKIIKN